MISFEDNNLFKPYLFFVTIESFFFSSNGKKYDSALSNSGPIEDQLLLKDLEKFFETNKGNENGPKE